MIHLKNLTLTKQKLILRRKKVNKNIIHIFFIKENGNIYFIVLPHYALKMQAHTTLYINEIKYFTHIFTFI